MTLTVEEILRGTTTGRMQSVGHMGVIPILDPGDGASDDSFAPPRVHVSVPNYGSVRVRNSQDRMTIVPPGSAWVVDAAVQDHATGTGALVKKTTEINTAMCVQQSQPGQIQDAEYPLTILPAPLRVRALATRKDREYSRLWGPIQEFKKSVGLTGAGNLVDFLRHFEKELDQFVAQFELMPNQIGSIVLLDGKIVGVERAPNAEFWAMIWNPLIRVCYGALAIRARQKLGGMPPRHRIPLNPQVKSLAGIGRALNEVKAKTSMLTQSTREEAGKHELKSGGMDQELEKIQLTTVANQLLAGQVVQNAKGKVSYASLCAAGA